MLGLFGVFFSVVCNIEKLGDWGDWGDGWGGGGDYFFKSQTFTTSLNLKEFQVTITYFFEIANVFLEYVREMGNYHRSSCNNPFNEPRLSISWRGGLEEISMRGWYVCVYVYILHCRGDRSTCPWGWTTDEGTGSRYGTRYHTHHKATSEEGEREREIEKGEGETL